MLCRSRNFPLLWAMLSLLKGTVSRDFLLLVFFLNQFPPSLWLLYTISAISNFFENSRRYSQLKVCHRCQRHRWQMEKTFKQKNFNNFVWPPLGSRVNIHINFCLLIHFMVSAAWYCCHYFPPVSTTPVANLPPVSLIPLAICHRRRWHQWQNLPPVSLTPVANLPPASTTLAKMVEKFATGVADTGGAPWLANISANFRKNLKRSKGNTLGLGGNWLMKKTRIKKSRDTVPLREGLGRRKPATNPWNKHKQHNCGDFYYIQAILNRLL